MYLSSVSSSKYKQFLYFFSSLLVHKKWHILFSDLYLAFPSNNVSWRSVLSVPRELPHAFKQQHSITLQDMPWLVWLLPYWWTLRLLLIFAIYSIQCCNEEPGTYVCRSSFRINPQKSPKCLNKIFKMVWLVVQIRTSAFQGLILTFH